MDLFATTARMRGTHREGPVAKGIEERTSEYLPSTFFMALAGASILGSLALQVMGYRERSLFVGQWAPTFLTLGIYNKLVKTMGSER